MLAALVTAAALHMPYMPLHDSFILADKATISTPPTIRRLCRIAHPSGAAPYWPSLIVLNGRFER